MITMVDAFAIVYTELEFKSIFVSLSLFPRPPVGFYGHIVEWIPQEDFEIEKNNLKLVVNSLLKDLNPKEKFFFTFYQYYDMIYQSIVFGLGATQKLVCAVA